MQLFKHLGGAFRRVVAVVGGCFSSQLEDKLAIGAKASTQPAPKTARSSYDTGTTAAPNEHAPVAPNGPKAVETLLSVGRRGTPRPRSSDGRAADSLAPHDARITVTSSAPDLHTVPSPSDALAPEVDVGVRSKSTDALPTREDSLPISISSDDSGTPKGNGSGNVKTGATTSSGTVTGRPGGGGVKQKH